MDDDTICTITANDGTQWEIRHAGCVPCEVRKKGAESWEEAHWGVFCEKYGIETDALSQ
jgi:hypothetical protein